MGIEQILAAIPWETIIIQTVNGIVTGMILALIASGLTLIFGIMDVVNFAHGELFMLGAYIGVVVLATSGSFWLALVIATLVVALIGAALQITTLRPLLGRDPLTTILATFGISLVLQNYALLLFGPLVGVNHAMGLDWVLKAFIVVVVGGMGNLGGSIAASIFISLLEAYASIWVSPAQAVIVSFVVLILTLLFRPTGLFVPTPK